jgi:hypothetical protein
MALDTSWRLKYLLEERTEGGAASLVSGLYCDVSGNAIIVMVWGVVL